MPSDFLMNRHMAKLGMAPQSVSWSEGPLTFDEVSKFFSVPIAEAAQKLSVCGSVLQRICKENGIPRWPYRKVMAGKSIEEIREEGLKEMAANPSSYKKAETVQPTATAEGQTPQPPAPATPAAFSPSAPQLGPNLATGSSQADPKTAAAWQQESALTQHPQPQIIPPQRTTAAEEKTPGYGAAPPQRVGPQSTPTHMHSPAAANYTRSPIAAGISPSQTAQKPKVAVTTPPDDFKFGFPSKSLSATSSRWWGSAEKDPVHSAGSVAGVEEVLPAELGRSIEGLVEGVVSDVGPSTTASSLLVRTRKKAVLRGHSALAHAVTRGYGIQKLGAKEAAALRFVLGDHLPKHWACAFPPVS